MLTKLRSILVASLFMLSGASAALALDANEMFDDPAKEARAREVGRQLRCLVCQNQSIFDSNSGLAKDLRVVVRERMDAGDTDAQILDFVSVRFGEYVLLKPRIGTQTYFLWGSPVLLLLIGLLVLVSYHRRRPKLSAPVELTDEDRTAARKILGNMERD